MSSSPPAVPTVSTKRANLFAPWVRLLVYTKELNADDLAAHGPVLEGGIGMSVAGELAD